MLVRSSTRAGRPGFGWAARLVLCGAVLGVPSGAFASPWQTTIQVRPLHAAPGEVFHVTGDGHCTRMLATLDYTDYDGRGKYAGNGDDDAKYNAHRQVNEYAIDIQVPADAKPGTRATIYAEGLCNSYDVDPPSKNVELTIDVATPRLTVSPAGVRPGRAVTVSGSGCYGPGAGTVPLRASWPGGVTDVTARRSGDRFSASFTVPVSAGVGAGSVTLTGDAECPGSRLPASGSFRVLAPVRPPPGGSVSPSVSPSPRPSGAGSASAAPSSSLPSPSGSSAGPVPEAGANGGSGGGWWALVAGLVLAAGGTGLVVWLRRPRMVPGHS